ncbi:MAG: ARMT1-like domain-containing protein [Thermoplasmata archaeon]
MRTYPECVVCYLRQVLEALELNNANEQIKKEVIFKAGRAMEKMDFSKSPFENTGIPHSIVARMLGLEDPYARAKREMNRKAMAILKKLGLEKKEVKLSSIDFLLQLSAAGNWLDYGPPVEKNLEKISEMLGRKSSVYGRYRQNLKMLERNLAEEKLRIAFLGDNAGEIFFDRFLCAFLAAKHEVTYFVKEKPWINDAMIPDASAAGLEAYAHLDVVPIKNWKLRLRSPDFLGKLRRFDLVIAKGQGNYETLAGENLRCFYLFIAKCRLVAAECGGKQGEIVLEARGV